MTIILHILFFSQLTPDSCRTFLWRVVWCNKIALIFSKKWLKALLCKEPSKSSYQRHTRDIPEIYQRHTPDMVFKYYQLVWPNNFLGLVSFWSSVTLTLSLRSRTVKLVDSSAYRYSVEQNQGVTPSPLYIFFRKGCEPYHPDTVSHPVLTNEQILLLVHQGLTDIPHIPVVCLF